MSMPDADRRTLPATPRHLRKLRQQGVMAHSIIMGPALSVAALPIVVVALLGGLPGFVRYMVNVLSLPTSDPAVPSLRFAMEALAIGPVFVVIGIIALSGVHLRLPFRLQSLSWAANLRRLFSRQSLSQAGLIILGLAVMGLIWWMLWRRVSPTLTWNPPADPDQTGTFALSTLRLLLMYIAAVGLLLAAGGFLVARRGYRRQANMTPEEFKEDLKSGEGDPHVRARWAQLRQMFYSERMSQQMARADMVVVNPTHYAVALAYEPWLHGAPTVVASGRGERARVIRQLAEELHVPLLASPPLARDLYRNVKVGQEVPARLYQAVADLLAYLMKHYGYKPRTAPDREDKS